MIDQNNLNQFIKIEHQYPNIFKILNLNLTFTETMEELERHWVDCMRNRIDYTLAFGYKEIGDSEGLNFEDSKLIFFNYIDEHREWLNHLKELSSFYEIIKQTRFNNDFIEFCFSKASLLNESDKATMFDAFKNLFEIKPEDQPQTAQPPSKIKWNGTHEELCVYWGYAGNCELIEMGQNNESKIINWNQLAEHFVVLNKKTKKYEDLTDNYKSTFSSVMKSIEGSKATQLKKPKAIIRLIDEINESSCES